MTDGHGPPRVIPARGSGTGTVMIVIGLLILVPSGLCTGAFGIGSLIDILGHNDTGYGSAILSVALTIGGPFVLFGGALLWAGLRRRRASRVTEAKP